MRRYAAKVNLYSESLPSRLQLAMYGISTITSRLKILFHEAKRSRIFVVVFGWVPTEGRA